MDKRFVINLNKPNIVFITCFSCMYAIFASFAYGYSYELFMAFVVIIMFVTYVPLIRNSRRISARLLLIFLVLVIISVFNGWSRGNLTDPIVVSPCLILPITLSGYDYDGVDNYRKLIPCCLLTLFIVIFQISTNFLINYNVNTLGFVLYMGGAFSFIWLKKTEKKVYPIIYIALMLIVMLKTDCRNAMIVMFLSLILLFIPDQIIKKPSVYRSIYIITILYTIFAFGVLEFAFTNPKINVLLNQFSSRFSSKTYGMGLRIEYFLSIKAHINQLSLYEHLFGQGLNNGSGHNMFYQSLFVYGYIGTIIIYTFYIYVFEKCYQLILYNDDVIAYGCFIALIGNIAMQGADEYLICNPTCVFVPFLMIGIILSRQRQLRYKKECG